MTLGRVADAGHTQDGYGVSAGKRAGHDAGQRGTCPRVGHTRHLVCGAVLSLDAAVFPADLSESSQRARGRFARPGGWGRDVLSTFQDIRQTVFYRTSRLGRAG
jgi:hypothetical protein